MVEVRNQNTYYIKLVYPLVVFFLFWLLRFLITYNRTDIKNATIKNTRIFIAWILWVLLFFLIKLFSKEEKRNTEQDKEDQMDQRIKEAQQNFLKYQKDSLNRSRYLDMLKNKIQSNGKLTYDTKKNHKRNILGFKFSYIEDKMEENHEEEEVEEKPAEKSDKLGLIKKKTSAFDRSMTKKKTDGGSSGNIFSMVKNLNKNELEKE